MSTSLNGRFPNGIWPFNSTAGQRKIGNAGGKKNPPALGMKLVAPAEDAALRVNAPQIASHSIESD